MNILTDKERDLIDALGEVWSRFLDEPALHPDERTDFRRAIHDAQRIVMARPFLRQERQAPTSSDRTTSNQMDTHQ